MNLNLYGRINDRFIPCNGERNNKESDHHGDLEAAGTSCEASEALRSRHSSGAVRP